MNAESLYVRHKHKWKAQKMDFFLSIIFLNNKCSYQYCFLSITLRFPHTLANSPSLTIPQFFHYFQKVYPDPSSFQNCSRLHNGFLLKKFIRSLFQKIPSHWIRWLSGYMAKPQYLWFILFITLNIVSPFGKYSVWYTFLLSFSSFCTGPHIVKKSLFSSYI